MRRILVIDDEVHLAVTLAAILERSGYAVHVAHDGDSALAVIPHFTPDLIISDVVMPGMTGIELAMHLRELREECRLMLFSGNAATQDLLEEAQARGVSLEVVAKPIPPRDLLARVEHLLNSSSGHECGNGN